MLEVLKNKKVLIGIIIAIIFVGVIGIICWIGNSDKNGSNNADEIIEVLPDGEEGLEVEDEGDKETSEPSIDAPSSWEDGENTQTENSNSNTENKNENVGNNEETEQNGNVSNEDLLEDDDTSYGEIL